MNLYFFLTNSDATDVIPSAVTLKNSFEMTPPQNPCLGILLNNFPYTLEAEPIQFNFICIAPYHHYGLKGLKRQNIYDHFHYSIKIANEC